MTTALTSRPICSITCRPASTAAAAGADAEGAGRQAAGEGEEKNPSHEPEEKKPDKPKKPEEASLGSTLTEPSPGAPSELPARVYFTTVPAGAQIFRSSRRLCTTPCTIKVRAELGSLEVAIRRDGYLDEWVSVELEAGETSRSHVKLISDPGI